MSQKELQRIKVIENAVDDRITTAEASVLLKLSERQVKRLKAKYQADNVDWVRHGNTGQEKPWRLSETVRARIVELARDKYAGFNDSHLAEKLATVEGIKVSRETVRRVLREAGIKSPQKRRAPKYRARRERKPRVGMMVLTDASREDWLEGRGPVLTLIGYQDDASSRVVAAAFQVEHEDTVGYLRQLRSMVDRYGVPLSVYRDQHGTFQRNDKHWTLEEELAGRQSPTQFGRVLEQLGIESIRALSPQAKGRIERMWKTFQDRLISELRLAQAATLEQAQAVLNTFIEEYNRSFAVAPKETASDFRPLPKKINRERLFSLKYERTVGKDHVIQFGARQIQLPAKKGKYGYANSRVELSHQLDGKLVVWSGDERLHTVELPLHYPPGEAPKRPSTRRQKQPRIYAYAGHPATALR